MDENIATSLKINAHYLDVNNKPYGLNFTQIASFFQGSTIFVGSSVPNDECHNIVNFNSGIAVNGILIKFEDNGGMPNSGGVYTDRFIFYSEGTQKYINADMTCGVTVENGIEGPYLTELSISGKGYFRVNNPLSPQITTIDASGNSGGVTLNASLASSAIHYLYSSGVDNIVGTGLGDSFSSSHVIMANGTNWDAVGTGQAYVYLAPYTTEAHLKGFDSIMLNGDMNLDSVLNVSVSRDVFSYVYGVSGHNVTLIQDHPVENNMLIVNGSGVIALEYIDSTTVSSGRINLYGNANNIFYPQVESISIVSQTNKLISSLDAPDALSITVRNNTANNPSALEPVEIGLSARTTPALISNQLMEEDDNLYAPAVLKFTADVVMGGSDIANITAVADVTFDQDLNFKGQVATMNLAGGDGSITVNGDLNSNLDNYQSTSSTKYVQVGGNTTVAGDASFYGTTNLVVEGGEHSGSLNIGDILTIAEPNTVGGEVIIEADVPLSARGLVLYEADDNDNDQLNLKGSAALVLGSLPKSIGVVDAHLNTGGVSFTNTVSGTIYSTGYADTIIGSSGIDHFWSGIEDDDLPSLPIANGTYWHGMNSNDIAYILLGCYTTTLRGLSSFSQINIWGQTACGANAVPTLNLTGINYNNAQFFVRGANCNTDKVSFDGASSVISFSDDQNYDCVGSIEYGDGETNFLVRLNSITNQQNIELSYTVQNLTLESVSDTPSGVDSLLAPGVINLFTNGSYHITVDYRGSTLLTKIVVNNVDGAEFVDNSVMMGDEDGLSAIVAVTNVSFSHGISMSASTLDTSQSQSTITVGSQLTMAKDSSHDSTIKLGDNDVFLSTLITPASTLIVDSAGGRLNISQPLSTSIAALNVESVSCTPYTLSLNGGMTVPGSSFSDNGNGSIYIDGLGFSTNVDGKVSIEANNDCRTLINAIGSVSSGTNTVTITGDHGLTISQELPSALTIIDASGNSGGVNIDASAATSAVTFYSSSVADHMIGTNQEDNFYSGTWDNTNKIPQTVLASGSEWSSSGAANILLGDGSTTAKMSNFGYINLWNGAGQDSNIDLTDSTLTGDMNLYYYGQGNITVTGINTKPNSVNIGKDAANYGDVFTFGSESWTGDSLAVYYYNKFVVSGNVEEINNLSLNATVGAETSLYINSHKATGSFVNIPILATNAQVLQLSGLNDDGYAQGITIGTLEAQPHAIYGVRGYNTINGDVVMTDDNGVTTIVSTDDSLTFGGSVSISGSSITADASSGHIIVTGEFTSGGASEAKFEVISTQGCDSYALELNGGLQVPSYYFNVTGTGSMYVSTLTYGAVDGSNDIYADLESSCTTVVDNVIASGARNYYISGSGRFNVTNTLPSSITFIDASANAGGISIDASGASQAVIYSSSSADYIVATSPMFISTGVYNTDDLSVSSSLASGSIWNGNGGGSAIIKIGADYGGPGTNAIISDFTNIAIAGTEGDTSTLDLTGSGQNALQQIVYIGGDSVTVKGLSDLPAQVLIFKDATNSGSTFEIDSENVADEITITYKGDLQESYSKLSLNSPDAYSIVLSGMSTEGENPMVTIPVLSSTNANAIINGITNTVIIGVLESNPYLIKNEGGHPLSISNTNLNMIGDGDAVSHIETNAALTIAHDLHTTASKLNITGTDYVTIGGDLVISGTVTSDIDHISELDLDGELTVENINNVEGGANANIFKFGGSGQFSAATLSLLNFENLVINSEIDVTVGTLLSGDLAQYMTFTGSGSVAVNNPLPSSIQYVYANQATGDILANASDATNAVNFRSGTGVSTYTGSSHNDYFYSGQGGQFPANAIAIANGTHWDGNDGDDNAYILLAAGLTENLRIDNMENIYFYGDSNDASIVTIEGEFSSDVTQIMQGEAITLNNIPLIRFVYIKSDTPTVLNYKEGVPGATVYIDSTSTLGNLTVNQAVDLIIHNPQDTGVVLTSLSANNVKMLTLGCTNAGASLAITNPIPDSIDEIDASNSFCNVIFTAGDKESFIYSSARADTITGGPRNDTFWSGREVNNVPQLVLANDTSWDGGEGTPNIANILLGSYITTPTKMDNFAEIHLWGAEDDSSVIDFTNTDLTGTTIYLEGEKLIGLKGLNGNVVIDSGDPELLSGIGYNSYTSDSLTIYANHDLNFVIVPNTVSTLYLLTNNAVTFNNLEAEGGSLHMSISASGDSTLSLDISGNTKPAQIDVTHGNAEFTSLVTMTGDLVNVCDTCSLTFEAGVAGINSFNAGNGGGSITVPDEQAMTLIGNPNSVDIEVGGQMLLGELNLNSNLS